MGKAYSKRPSQFLPKGAFNDSERFSFDLNVYLSATLAERETRDEQVTKGPTRNRADAMRLIRNAKRDVAEMKAEKHG